MNLQNDYKMLRLELEKAVRDMQTAKANFIKVNNEHLILRSELETLCDKWKKEGNESHWPSRETQLRQILNNKFTTQLILSNLSNSLENGDIENARKDFQQLIERTEMKDKEKNY